jgi:YD repeat-containing protein
MQLIAVADLKRSRHETLNRSQPSRLKQRIVLPHTQPAWKVMKSPFGFAFLFVASTQTAQAEQVWFALDSPAYPPSPDMVHYPTADSACQVAYAADVPRFTSDVSHVLPYTPPIYWKDFGLPAYKCEFKVIIGSGVNTLTHIIAVAGDVCPSGQTFDATTGQCAPSTDQQDRRQRGDPDDEANNDPSSCHGDPINAAIGNEFEKLTDYSDRDGELQFVRFYNSSEGRWRHSYGASLVQLVSSATLTFDDGRASVFSMAGNVATGEPTERGSLVKSGSNWVYSSPDNETLTFNGDGQLTSYKASSGLVQTLSYGYDPTFTKNQVTIKDSRDHTLVFSEDIASGQLSTLSAPGVSAVYTYNSAGMLAMAARTLQGKTTTQSYLYEDTKNATHLTGLVDERGIRASTWTYDADGRATSSIRSAGLDKTTIDYADDGTTTVTNALGHVVTYKYAVIAGTRQMVAVKGEPALACPVSNSSFTYDTRGQISTQTDALGHVTAFAYDTQGRITSKTEAKGTAQERVTTTTWDGTTFRPKTVTTPDRVMTYTYDTKGRLIGTKASTRNP